MSFRDIDEARKNNPNLANANNGKNRKRKGAPGQISDIDTVNGVSVSDRRRGEHLGLERRNYPEDADYVRWVGEMTMLSL